MVEKKLYRSCANRVIAGVCGGLGEYFDIDPVIIRLILVLLVLAGGAGILFYILAWIIIPEDPACRTKKDKISDEIREKGQTFAQEIKKEVRGSRRSDETRVIGGLIVLAIGLLFLLQNIFGWNAWSSFWPVILIIIGLIIVVNSARRK